MKKGLIFSLVLVSGLLVAQPSFGSYGSVACQPIYGGGQTCVTTDKILIDKKVLDPNSNTKGNAEVFVDNLTMNNSKYRPDQRIKFQLIVTNTSDSALSEVTVSDIFPEHITFVSGPGSYDSKSRTLTFKISGLKANESRKFVIEGKVAASGKLPSGQGIVCQVNMASAVAEGKESKDNSQFCIEKATTKGGLPVMDAPKNMKQTPATGPEAFALIGLIPAGLSGLILRRKAIK
jgi:uncharacterized repeat protein (TIGR01451 family)